MTAVKLLGVCGSLRADSLNRKLLAVAVTAARRAGATVDVVDLRDTVLPIFDEDLEAPRGTPPPVVLAAAARVAAADGLIVASPEYNYSIPGGLKNFIDWMSQPPETVRFAGKTVVTLTATPHPHLTGGMCVQEHLRQMFSCLSAWVVPTQLIVPNAPRAFDRAGRLVDPALAKAVTRAIRQLVDHCAFQRHQRSRSRR